MKPIKNFLGYYVDSLGNVYSEKYGYLRNLKATPDNTGHLRLTLCMKNKKINKLVARLVAETFIQNPASRPCVLHYDGNPINNRIENLYWGDKKDNARDSIRHNTFVKADKNGNARLNWKQVRFLRMLNENFNMGGKRISKIFKGFYKLTTINNVIYKKNWISKN